ncbi:MAG TPA: biopolymer transporter ExbD, partial [Polyangia bacterium]
SNQAAAAVVAREAKANPKLQAVIAADKSVPYGRVVELIDLVKQNGVSAFALDVERGEASATGAPAAPAPASP